MPDFDSIVLHCTYRIGVPDHRYFDWPGIVNHHVNELQYDFPGYHVGIEKIKGLLVVCPGRPFSREGAHCRDNGMNRRALGVAVIGNFDIAPPDKETYYLLARVCEMLMLKFPKVTVDRIFPHNAFSTKTCPGRKFDTEKVKYLVAQVV